MLRLDNKLTLN